jgi:predicted HD superfamily hydrolase involved in NAD metabolism
MFDNIKEELIKNIGLKRYNHSLGVMNVATKLAVKYDCDVEKAKTAGVLHDCAKFRDKSQLFDAAKHFNLKIDRIMQKNTELIHGPLGAKIANACYGIDDLEVLDAIKYHTIGRENMSMLDKIIYIADYIEPGRSFPGVEEIREIVFLDLDDAIKKAMDNTILFLIKDNKLIHPDTINARNYMLYNEE